MGLDGHDRGVKVIARALRDSGVHVIYSGLWQTPRSLAISARDEDCDVVCASMMSNSHLVLGPKLVNELRSLGRPDLPVYMGGILPQEDLPKLAEAGVARCFTTGVGLLDIVNAVHGAVQARKPVVAGSGATAQLARDISLVHAGGKARDGAPRRRPRRVIGVTGSPGAGKSTLVAQLVTEFTRRSAAGEAGYSGRCAVVAFDPMSPITGGALLGDRLRVDFNTLDERAYYRSLAISGEDYGTLSRRCGGVRHRLRGDRRRGPERDPHPSVRRSHLRGPDARHGRCRADGQGRHPRDRRRLRLQQGRPPGRG
jgi:methylmalonyl-CoA mutase cobalamin-binding domain/chain